MNRPSPLCAGVTAALLLLFPTCRAIETRLLAQDAPPAAARSVVDGVFTASQASRGRLQFEQICTACHTPGEHTGRKFETKWQGTTVGDLFDLVSSTMPQGDPGSLKPEDYAGIVAFFLSETGYKAGEQELPVELEALKKIRIEPVPR
jgi:mono/diheme cytochrome c family protein